MKRLQLLVVEIFAVLAFWALWDLRVAASLFVLLLVAGAFMELLRSPVERPGAPAQERSPIRKPPPAGSAPGPQKP